MTNIKRILSPEEAAPFLATLEGLKQHEDAEETRAIEALLQSIPDTPGPMADPPRGWWKR